MRKILWNGSIKSELHGVLYVVLEGAPKVPHYRVFKNAQKGVEKDTFSAAVDVLLDGSIEGALGGYSECTSKDALIYIKMYKKVHVRLHFRVHLSLHLSYTRGCSCWCTH